MREYEQLLAHAKKKKRFEEKEIIDILNINDYSSQYVPIIKKLTMQGLIRPVTSSGYNGRNPALYKKYQVIKPNTNYSILLDEIKFSLYPSFSKDYYIKHPEKFNQDREYINSLSNFFYNEKDELEVSASINERSYQIFKDEKFLSGDTKSMAKSILKNLNISLNDLNVYMTPESLLYYTADREYPTYLIIENKDTWYTLKKLLKAGKDTFHGIKIGTVVFGEGNKLLNSSIDYLAELLEINQIPKQVQFFYLGDVDYKGIEIFLRFKQNYSNYCIQPFTRFYSDMIDLYTNSNKLMKEGNKTNKNIKMLPEFLNYFSAETQDKINNILNARCYIPQEILTYKYFTNT